MNQIQETQSFASQEEKSGSGGINKLGLRAILL